MEFIQEKNNYELCANIVDFNMSVRDLHWHNNIEICQIVKNSCRFLIDGRLVEANEGDIIVINEQTVHRFLIDYDETQILILQFPLKVILNLNATITPVKTHISKDEILRIPNLSETINFLFNIISGEDDAKTSTDNPFLQSLMTSLYFLLTRNFPADEGSNHSKKEKNEFFKITQYVNNHYTEELNINSLAESLYMSRGKLAAVFFKYAGISLKVYINILRIRKANQLLADGEDITSAAMASGFQSIRTFNNTYKLCMGITPTEYIKMHINR